MKAAICYEYGKPLVIEDVEIDPPQTGEVKVHLAATAVCHSDIHCVRGDLGGFPPLPFVPGHESSGYVDAIGANVTLFKPGDRVVVCNVATCGKCYYCVNGWPTMCEAKWPLERGTRLRNKRGQRLNTNKKMANFAEYVIVDESQLVKLPPEMPIELGSLLACGVVTGFGAVVNRAKVKPLSSVVVIGTGGVGLNSIQGAVVSGASRIIGVDISDYKLKAAKEFGATHTVNSKNEDAVKAVWQITGGKGADYVFVTVGSPAAMRQGFAMAGKRGMTVIVGLPAGGAELSIPVFDFIELEKTLTGAAMGDVRLSIDVPYLIDLYHAKRLKLDELITGRYPLEQINEAIRSTEEGEALRNIIIF
jgi:S-(hydroxymethyl)glutathione dehydrogenase / alcohol dehydrogenase